MTWLWIGLGIWGAISLPAAFGVGRALRRVAARQTAASSRPNLRAV